MITLSPSDLNRAFCTTLVAIAGRITSTPPSPRVTPTQSAAKAASSRAATAGPSALPVSEALSQIICGAPCPAASATALV